MGSGSLSIPLAIFLIPFGIFILIFLFYAGLNVYHLIRFGVHGFHLYFVVTLFVLGSFVLLVGSILSVAQYDWSASLAITNLFELSSDLTEI